MKIPNFRVSRPVPGPAGGDPRIPLLNGIVNYEYWLPTPAMDFPRVSNLIATYQGRAKATQADALGYYVAPFAYAQRSGRQAASATPSSLTTHGQPASRRSSGTCPSGRSANGPRPES